MTRIHFPGDFLPLNAGIDSVVYSLNAAKVDLGSLPEDAEVWDAVDMTDLLGVEDNLAVAAETLDRLRRRVGRKLRERLLIEAGHEELL